MKRRMFLGAVVAAVLFSSPLIKAAPYRLSSDGTKVYELVYEDGVPTYVYRGKVEPVGDGTATPPTNPPTDPPTNPPDPPAGDDTITKTAHDLAIAINRPQEAAVLGAIYDFAAQQLNSGKLSPEAIHKYAKTMRDIALAKVDSGAKERWKSFGKTIDGLMKDQPVSELYGFLVDVGYGLTKAAGLEEMELYRVVQSTCSDGPQKQYSGSNPQEINFLEIFEIIRMILELLQSLGWFK